MKHCDQRSMMQKILSNIRSRLSELKANEPAVRFFKNKSNDVESLTRSLTQKFYQIQTMIGISSPIFG